MRPIDPLSYFPLFRIFSFNILLLGRVISGIGHILYSMATMWYILEFTDSALSAATTLILPYLIFILFGIPLATISDRLPKRKILIGTDLARAVIALGSVLLFFAGTLLPWHIYISNLLISIAGFLFNPAAQSILPSILPDSQKQLAAANGLLNAVSKSIELIGYVGAGILISLLSLDLILVIYIAVFLVSGLSFLFMKYKEPEVKKSRGVNGFVKDSIEGVRFIFSKQVLRYCVVFGAILNLVAAPLQIFTPIFSNYVLNIGSEGYGYLQSSFAFGGIIGALLSGRYSKRLKLAQWFFISFLISGVSMALMAIFPNIIFAIILSACLMFGLSLSNVPLITAIILATPEHMRGRVMNSLGVLLSGVSCPAGLLLGGMALDSLDISVVYTSTGWCIVFMGLISLFIKSFYNENELSQDVMAVSP